MQHQIRFIPVRQPETFFFYSSTSTMETPYLSLSRPLSSLSSSMLLRCRRPPPSNASTLGTCIRVSFHNRFLVSDTKHYSTYIRRAQVSCRASRANTRVGDGCSPSENFCLSAPSRRHDPSCPLEATRSYPLHTSASARAARHTQLTLRLPPPALASASAASALERTLARRRAPLKVSACAGAAAAACSSLHATGNGLE